MRFLAILFPALVVAQSNLDFSQGTTGAAPDGWFVPAVVQAAGYTAEVRHDGCEGGANCAVLVAPARPPENTFGNLVQTFDATPWRGKAVRLRASMRVEPGAGSHAQMWLRVDLAGGRTGFFDNMGDRPVAPDRWTRCEISGEVAADATAIHIGVMSFGGSRVWIGNVTFEAMAQSAPEADRTALKSAYRMVDAAYGRGDLEAIRALAAPDAQVRLGSTQIALADALSGIRKELEGGAKYESHSAITSVRVEGATATVWVNNESTRTNAEGRRTVATTSRDTWIRAEAGWRLKESSLIATRPAGLETDPATAKAVATELERKAAPLAGVAAGAPATDLAAFGKAVGDARMVALGEASHGTREFFQMNHRLFEYLVKEKGFTVLAIEANWPESLAVDRYIKTGEGDPRAALAGMYFWTWNTEEVLALVEWMRAWNQAGGHAPLTFTSFDMQTGGVAAEKVLEYLKEHAPDAEGPAAEAYAAVEDVEAERGQVYSQRAKAAADRALTVVKVFDGRREQMVSASSFEEWRDARQAASIVYQACAMRIPGKGPAWRDEAMARNAEWLASEVHPKEKIVLWAHNSHAGLNSGDLPKSMGNWLRERYGKQMYAAGFAFRRGQVRAIGTRQGSFTGLAVEDVPPAPEGSGDAVLGGAGMPLFFLDMANLAPGTLRRWLEEPHSYYEVGATWAIGDPQSNLQPEAPAKRFDGLIYIEESHASRPVAPE